MTRRLFCGVLCIVLALLLGVSGEVYLRTAVNRLLTALQPQPEAGEAGLFDAALQAAEEWDSLEKLLSAVIKHSDADALGVLFEQLKISAEKRDAAAVRANLESCASQVRVLLAGERLRWENILRVGLRESNPNRFFRAEFSQYCFICLDNTPVLSAAASLS